MRVGFPGKVFEVPYPESGMGFNTEGTTELTDLYTGGKHVRLAPTTYKTFNMSWSTWADDMQGLVDLYNKRYGNRAFYLTDPLAKGNLLPARWAYSYQLAHIARGQGTPSVDTAALVPKSVFTDKFWSSEYLTTRVLLVPDKDHYLKVWGTGTGTAGIRYRLHSATAAPGTWGAWSTLVPDMVDATAATLVCPAANTATNDFIELQVYVPVGSTLSLTHMDLGNTAGVITQRPAEGVGALRFTNTLQGELVSSRIRRIGMSVDVTEVEIVRE